MPSPEPFLIFTRKFGELGLPYMVSGSVAAIFYGEPRMTNDVDIIVFFTRSDASSLARAFPLEEFYCPPDEVLQLEAARERRGHFNRSFQSRCGAMFAARAGRSFRAGRFISAAARCFARPVHNLV